MVGYMGVYMRSYGCGQRETSKMLCDDFFNQGKGVNGIRFAYVGEIYHTLADLLMSVTAAF